MPDYYLPPGLQRRIARDLRRVERDVAATSQDLRGRVDCDQVLARLAAVQLALQETASLLVEGHFSACVVPALRAGDRTQMEHFRRNLRRLLR